MKTLARLASVVCLGWCLGSSADAGDGTAIGELKARANGGDANAQVQLGLRYLQGNGVEKNPAEAAKWYQKAAQQTNHVALFSLARMYENGQGVPRNPAEALKYYRKAAEEGYSVAQRILSGMYARGHLVQKDPLEAFKWARRAAEPGDAYAQMLLAQYYATGQGTGKDLVEACALLTLAGSTLPQAKTNLTRLQSSMTVEQVAKAQQRALELKQGQK